MNPGVLTPPGSHQDSDSVNTKATAPESIGIKELKARLVDYVDRIRKGERFVVTDRGEPVAELIPLSPERLALAKLAQEGVVDWHGGKPKGLRGVVVRGEPVSETVLRDRDPAVEEQAES